MELIRKIERLEPNPQRLEDIFTLIVGGDGDDTDLRFVRRHGRRLGQWDLLKRSYIYGARQGSFDDYMIACEWDREPNARFWLPRRAVLEGKHGVATEIERFIADEEARYLGLSCPPGTGKSTLIKFLLAFIAGEFPASANMYVSYSDGMIKMMYDSVSAIMTDAGEYNHGLIFDNGVPVLSAEYKTISHRKKGDFPTIGMVAMGGSVTGRTRANKFLVTDDLVKNAEVARSPERLNKLYEDYKSTLTTRMIGDDVKEIQLGTIWSAHDPISRRKRDLDAGRRNWFITLPVKDAEGHSNFDYDHPDHYSDEKIVELERELDSVTFQCLYMQNGIEREGLAFPADELRYYNGVLPDGEPDHIKAFCDVAWGGGDSLSMPIGYVYGDDVYIEDVVFDKGDKSVTKPRVVGKVMAHNVRAARFEANNGGDEYADSVSDTLKKEHKYSCNITHKKAPSTMSKLSRIEQYSPDIKRNFIFRSRGHRSPEYDKFMEEVCTLSFTSKNLHDDAPDSLAGLADFVSRGVKTIKATNRI